MLNWFKRNGRKKSLLSNWNIEDIAGFEKIQNPDSVQFVNEDGSKVIYLSVLTVSGNDVFPLNAYAGEPVVEEDSKGCLHLKSTKTFKNYILVCAITVNNRKDLEWAKNFFDSIKSH
jgi:hypothetical protein